MLPLQGPVIKQRRLGEVIGRDRMKPDAPVGPILDAVVKHAFEATKCACGDLLLRVPTAVGILVFLLQCGAAAIKGLVSTA